MFVLLDHYNLTKNSLYTLFGIVSSISVAPSYWKSSTNTTCYLLSHESSLIQEIAEVTILKIDLFITKTLDGDYGICYANSDSGNSLPVSFYSFQDISKWLKEHNLILSEFDITLSNYTRLKTYFGGDLLVSNLPKNIFDTISAKVFPQAEDFVLYQLDQHNQWKPGQKSIYSVEDFLGCNECLFFQLVNE
jgi:hypothetical protein